MKSVLLALVAILGLSAIVLAGFTPDPYLVHVRKPPPPFPFPLEGVATFCGILVVEAIALWSILRPSTYMHSWKRAALALLLSAGLMVLFGAGSMHSPPYYYAHFLWLIAVTFGLVLALAWAAASRFMRHAT